MRAIEFLLELSVLATIQQTSYAFQPNPVKRNRGSPLFLATVVEPIPLERTTQRDIGTFQSWAVEKGVQPGEGFFLEDYELDGNAEYKAMTSAGGTNGGLALFVPNDIIFSAARTYQDSQGALDSPLQVLNDKGMDHLAQHLVLFLYLLTVYEQGSQSEYYPWLMSLPRKWNTAASMTDFCIACLPPYLKSLCQEERKNLEVFTEALQQIPFISPETKDNEELLKFAYNIVRTRAFTSSDGDLKIIPVADMLNHGHPGNVKLEFDENGGCGVVFTRDVQPGEPLLLSYGEDSDTSQFFARYGYLNDGQTTFCKMMFKNPSRELLEVGYDPTQMVFNTETGEISQPVWDVLLYSRLENKPELADDARAFHQACIAGDEATKSEIEKKYFLDTCEALLNHVTQMLVDLYQLQLHMDAYDPVKHPRIPLIRKHHDMVKSTFNKVENRLNEMLGRKPW